MIETICLIAHRGANTSLPENTLEAIDEMVKKGSGWIEMDCQLSKDEKLIVIHDETLERTTNGKGKVSDFTLEELKQLDAGNWKSQSFQGAKIPTLEEVFERAVLHDFSLCIDLKGTQRILVDQIHQLIHCYQWDKRTMVYIYDEPTLEYARSLRPSYALFWGMGQEEVEELTQMHIEKAFHRKVGLTLDYHLLNKEILFAIEEKKIRTHVWTINEQKIFDQFAKYKIEAILTDTLI